MLSIGFVQQRALSIALCCRRLSAGKGKRKFGFGREDYRGLCVARDKRNKREAAEWERANPMHYVEGKAAVVWEKIVDYTKGVSWTRALNTLFRGREVAKSMDYSLLIPCHRQRRA